LARAFRDSFLRESGFPVAEENLAQKQVAQKENARGERAFSVLPTWG
jgi:hypothetical protein